MSASSRMAQDADEAMSESSWTAVAKEKERREEFKERYRDVEKSSEWTLERIREAHEKVARDAVGRSGGAGNFEKRYGLLAADHCASRWTGRSHIVVFLPAL